MLLLKPNCEYCDRDLPPDSEQACICSYECTFCRTCVDEVLHNVCPNCGGGFESRPLRPQRSHRPGVSLADQPASTQRVNTTLDPDAIADFSFSLRQLSPGER